MGTKHDVLSRSRKLFAWAGMILMTGVIIPGAMAGTVSVRVVDAHGKPVAQAVASLDRIDAPMPPAKGKLRAVMDQKGLSFVPEVLPVQAGTRVDFPNSDQVRHHVYSFSKAKRFQLQLYSGSHAPPVLFDTPGVVVLGCNIHDWMLGYIDVLDTPYFGKTGANGQAFIAHVPPGKYQLHLWHPRLKKSTQHLQVPVTVSAKGIARHQFKVQLHAPELSNRPPPGLDAGDPDMKHAHP